MGHPTLSIVVPMYNEEDNIDSFYFRITQALDKIGESYEIVCVNDGSRDRTLPLLLDLHQRDPRIKVIGLSRNFGKESALSAGIDYATGDAVIPIDADLQDPPAVIPQLIDKWREGYDVVYATRMEREGETWVKKWTAQMFYRVLTKITQIQIPKDTGDFRLMSRPVVEALKQLREQHRFMKGLFAWVGFRQTRVMYHREPRHAGTTKWNYWKLWNLAVEGITSFSHFPLQVAAYVGLTISVLAFLYALYLIGRTMMIGSDVPGYPSLMVVMLFLGGLQLFAIGVIGEYVGRIYIETKQRPLYFVRESAGFEQGTGKLRPPRPARGERPVWQERLSMAERSAVDAPLPVMEEFEDGYEHPSI
jgi:glycosyltransferase involved in cell wall biosynthesis